MTNGNTYITEDEVVHLVPATSVVARTAGMLKSRQPRLSPEQENLAVEEGLAEDVMEHR